MSTSWKRRGRTISILETIQQAHNGQLAQLLADRLGISRAIVDAGLAAAVTDIADHIRDKAQNDPQDYQDLFETIDDEEQTLYLSDSAWSFSDDALADGRHILEHLYGSAEAAVSQIAPERIDNDTAERFCAYVATYCVTALATRNQALMLSEQGDDDGAESWLQILLAALLKGFLQALKPRRRRRRYTRRRRSRRRRSTSRRYRRRRRRKNPSLNDLIGDLFRG